MQEEEAKKIAQKSWQKRFQALMTSGVGITGVVAIAMMLITSSYLAGYNQTPRVVMFAEVAQEHQKTLQEAGDDIKAAISDIGIENIPTDTQRKFAMALAKINLVNEALVPKPDDERGIFLPKFSSLIVTPAHAQANAQLANAKEDFRHNLAQYVLIAITLFWIICLIVYFSSKDEKKIAFAANMIQTVLGFYIGVFTGLLGLAPTSV